MYEVKLNSITKYFGRNSLAVDNLSVTFSSGEFVCLLGPSGCGKTTTLRMIAGLESPDNGEINYGNQIFFSSKNGEYLKTEKRNLGLMFQSYALVARLVHVGVYLSSVKASAAVRETKDRTVEIVMRKPWR